MPGEDLRWAPGYPKDPLAKPYMVMYYLGEQVVMANVGWNETMAYPSCAIPGEPQCHSCCVVQQSCWCESLARGAAASCMFWNAAAALSHFVHGRGPCLLNCIAAEGHGLLQSQATCLLAYWAACSGQPKHLPGLQKPAPGCCMRTGVLAKLHVWC